MDAVPRARVDDEPVEPGVSPRVPRQGRRGDRGRRGQRELEGRPAHNGDEVRRGSTRHESLLVNPPSPVENLETGKTAGES